MSQARLAYDAIVAPRASSETMSVNAQPVGVVAVAALKMQAALFAAAEQPAAAHHVIPPAEHDGEDGDMIIRSIN
jgi:hypothetical protein